MEKSIVEKIADTVSIAAVIVGAILVGAGLTDSVPEVTKWQGIIIESLTGVALILQIWGVNSTNKLNAPLIKEVEEIAAKKATDSARAR
jgi:hypothetical protein